jgi:hypothetical protein
VIPTERQPDSSAVEPAAQGQTLRQLGRPAAWLVVIAAVAGLALAAGYALPPGVDWRYVFRPGALSLLAGQSPYVTVERQSAAPWALLALVPLAILPEALGRGLLFVISLASFAYAAARLGAGRLSLAFFLLSPPVLHSLLNGNLDWIVALGCVLPPWIGIFLVAVKPQIGFGVVLFWLAEAWRAGKWPAVARLAAPIGVAYLLSFALFGFWPATFATIAEDSASWNASLWPYSIPVGLGLLVFALRRRQPRAALAASPCLSPYVLFHSWSVAVLAIVNSEPETIAVVVGLWVLIGLRVLNLGPLG